MRDTIPAVISAAMIALVASTAGGHAQSRSYGYGQDHTWSGGSLLDDTRARAGGGGMTAVTDPGVTPEKPVEPEKPKVEYRWKYATNGHVENTCTAGASVIELVPGCYDPDNNKVADGQCWGTPPYPSCKAWSINGGQGNCPTGWPTIGLGFVQTQEYASVGFMYDWKGTCYPSTITPFR